MTRRTAAWGLAAAGLLAATAGCAPARHDAPPPRARGEPPPAGVSSLLLISLDTFRGDAAGCGGDPGGRTPHLDRLARGGLQFRHGASPVPITLPSHASLLTGETPAGHGVRDNGTFRLAAEVPTLAEALRGRGFATGAFVAAFPLDARFGLDRGFDVYDDDRGARGEQGAFAMDQRGGGPVSAAAAAWLASLPDSARAFCLVHLFEAHSPWTAPAPRVAAAHGDGYRAEIAEADHWLGAAARAAELRGRAWIAVTGDHGESLGEHREATHGLFVYESTLDVPAVLWPAPRGQAPGVRDAVFRLVDFPATAFALLGLPAEEAPGAGRSALEAAGTAAAAAPVTFESLYGYFHHGWAPLRGVRVGDWKYVHAPEPELYHLPSDPGERDNVAARHPERAAELAELLERETSRPAAAAERLPLDEEARAALEALGYVTVDALEGLPHDDLPADGLPDPKAMAKVLSNLERAQAALAAGEPETALGLLRDAVSRDPRNKELHHLMGLAHAAAGRDDWAVDSFRRALDLPPHRNDRAPRFELASAWLRLGEPARAEAELRTLLAGSPRDGTAWYHLGLALEALGRPEEAREAWEAAVAREPELEAAVKASFQRSGPR